MDEEPEQAIPSPEQVTDDEIFNESDFEVIEGTVHEYGNETFWQVEESIDVEDEEAPKKKVLRDPGEPTKVERDEHRVDHIQFCRWCPFCAKGRGTGIQHRKIDEEATVPVFQFDYLLASEVAQDQNEESLKIRVEKCQMTKCVFTHGVPQKGLDPKLYVVERLGRDMLWRERNKIILKSDNGSVILAALRNIFKALRIENAENTREGHSAAYDSSSNATTVAACMSVAGQMRTVRSCLEGRVKKKIPATYCVFDWLIEHAAWLFTTRVCQSDGFTAHKKLKGVNFDTRLLGFGESCLCKVPKESA